MRFFGGRSGLKHLTGEALFRFGKAAYAALAREQKRINGLNVFPVPDGDTGTNMALTLKASIEAASGPGSLSQVAEAMAQGALRGARGNSGTILSQFVSGFFEGVKGLEKADPMQVAQALKSSSEAAYAAVGEPREGTMLTVGRAAAEGALSAAKQGANLIELFEVALERATRALDETPKLLDVLREAGVVDAGGEGLVVALRDGLAALKGEALPEAGTPEVAQGNAYGSDPHGSDPHAKFAIRLTDVEFQYCTEFLLFGDGLAIAPVRSALSSLGDSLLVVGTGSMLKVHIHTNEPGEVLRIACQFGEIDSVSIGNMKRQNQEHAHHGDGHQGGAALEGNGAPGAVGIVAVSLGAGFEALLRSQGVSEIVSGGQTMNPSAGELAEAVERLPQPHVILLPNNRNLLLSAQQVESLTTKRVTVLPTTSVTQAVSITVDFDPSRDVAETVAAMSQVLEEVRSGEVTWAVRDASLGGKSVAEGDAIGLVDGEIVAAGKSLPEVLCEVIEALSPARGELITLYPGADVTDEEAEAHRRAVEERWPGCDVEMYRGDQPIYAYWVSVE